MTQIKSIAVKDLVIGQAYNVARATNARGEAVVGTRRSDWRAVLITAEALAGYAEPGDGTTWYFQPISNRRVPALLAAGWTRLGISRGECGMEIVTRGPLLGLACAKPALWARGDVIPMCDQHAALADH